MNTNDRAIERLLRENRDLRRKLKDKVDDIDLCIAHLGLMQASFADQRNLYWCALCDAAPEEDHKPDCPLELSRQRLVEATAR